MNIIKSSSGHSERLQTIIERKQDQEKKDRAIRTATSQKIKLSIAE